MSRVVAHLQGNSASALHTFTQIEVLQSRTRPLKSVFRQENETNLEYTLDRPGPARGETN